MQQLQKLIETSDVAVTLASSDNEEDTLTKKMAKHWNPTPANYERRFTVDLNRDSDDPLFYCPAGKSEWLPEPVIRGHVTTLLRIVQEIALEDLKLDKKDFATGGYAENPCQGRVVLRISVEKSVLRQCCIELIPPGFLDLVRAVVYHDSTDKVYIDNRIEDSGLSREKAGEMLKRCTFPRSQAVAILYLAIHQPAAKSAWVWYKLALVPVHRTLAHKRPKYIEMFLDTDDPDAMTRGLELRNARQFKSETPEVKGIDSASEYEHYDEALHLAHNIVCEPRCPPLLGVLYEKSRIMLDFGFVYVDIRPAVGPLRRFEVCMGKHSRCGDFYTGDLRRVQEVLVETTELTIHEMRLKYDHVYQRQCQESKK